MNRTKIECFDYAWNVNVGCGKDGCPIPNCWAECMAKRQKHHCSMCYTFIPHIHKERFAEPLHSQAEEGRVAVGLMGEFFDKQLIHMSSWRNEVYNVMNVTPWFTYFILTKQPQNIPYSDKFPDNLWLGVTVNRKQDLWRIETLLSRIGGNPAFAFFEPLYEDLGEIDLEGLGWVVIGAQTKPKLLPKWAWVVELTSQASDLNIPIFLKNNLPMPSEARRLQEFPKGVKA